LSEASVQIVYIFRLSRKAATSGWNCRQVGLFVNKRTADSLWFTFSHRQLVSGGLSCML